MRSLMLCLLLAGLMPLSLSAQQDLSAVEIQTVPVAEGLYMLMGAGGNIGLSVGTDGAFMIDDQYAPLTEKIKAAVAAVTDQPIRYVVNTHWHGDHTGGNENMGQAGAVIVAHQNVRERMSTEQFVEAFNMRTPPAPAVALPVITFTDGITFYWNGESIDVFHVENAHTDGDAILYFENANAVHMGDTYFNGMYPFIDTASGGTASGVLNAMDIVLAMADDETKIIPGHGPLSNRAELLKARELLAVMHARVSTMINMGKTREEVVAAKPTADYDATYGGGFLNPEVWTGIFYDAIMNE